MGRSQTQIKNGKRHSPIWIVRSEEKNHIMGLGFDDFQSEFFDLAFLTATSYRNEGHFRP